MFVYLHVNVYTDGKNREVVKTRRLRLAVQVLRFPQQQPESVAMNWVLENG